MGSSLLQTRPAIHSRSCSKLLSPSSHSSGLFLLIRFLPFPTAMHHIPPTTHHASRPANVRLETFGGGGHTYTASTPTSAYANLDLLPLCSLPSLRLCSQIRICTSRSPHLLSSHLPSVSFTCIPQLTRLRPLPNSFTSSTWSTHQPPCMIKAANFSAFPIPADAISSLCSFFLFGM